MGFSHLYPSWVRPLRPRKRQVMSPSDAHLPKDRSSTDTDLCPFIYNYCLSIYCRLCTFTTHSLAQSIFKLNRVSFSLIFSCIACIALLASRLSSNTSFPLLAPTGSRRTKRSSETPSKISYFTRPCSHIPRARGSSLLRLHPPLPTGSWGPDSFTLLLKLGCPSGSFHGVGEEDGKYSRKLPSSLLSFSSRPFLLKHTTLKRHLGAQSQTVKCTFTTLSTAVNIDLWVAFTALTPKKGEIKNSLLLRSARAA